MPARTFEELRVRKAPEAPEEEVEMHMGRDEWRRNYLELLLIGVDVAMDENVEVWYGQDVHVVVQGGLWVDYLKRIEAVKRDPSLMPDSVWKGPQAVTTFEELMAEGWIKGVERDDGVMVIHPDRPPADALNAVYYLCNSMKVPQWWLVNE